MKVTASTDLCDRTSRLAAFAAGKATVKGIFQVVRFGTRMSRRTALCSSLPYEDGHHAALAKLTASELTQAALIEGRSSEKNESTSVPVTRDSLRAWRRREIRRLVKQVWRAVR